MMKEILALIESKKREFSQLPFFEYLRDRSIAPKQRLAFAPFVAPFVMSFGELNSSVFRNELISDPIQDIINKHTYEEDYHWLWFLEDLEKLGLNPYEPFIDTLKFLWSEKTRASRRAAYELYHHTVNSSPTQKLIIIESIEATSNTLLEVSSKVAQELQIFPEKQEYRFFGDNHLVAETKHTFCSSKAMQLVESIQLNREAKKDGFALVDRIFSVFTELVVELPIHAKSHHHTRNFKPLGSYLIEAGLIENEQLQEALIKQKSTPVPIGKILVSQGLINQQTIEYLMEKVIYSERQSLAIENLSFSRREKFEGNNQSNIPLQTLFSKSTKLGTCLVEAALISPEQLQAALDDQKGSSIPIGQILSHNGLVNQQTIEYLMEKIVLPERKIAVLN
jgi:hypothetical protein